MQAENCRERTAVCIPHAPCVLLDWLQDSTLQRSKTIILGDVCVFVNGRILYITETDNVANALTFLLDIGFAAIGCYIINDRRKAIRAERAERRPTGLAWN